MTAEARFFAKVQQGSPDSCWPWRGLFLEHGYGSAYSPVTKRFTTAHRVAYEYLVGPIPKGMYILHSCDNRACCNPAHLRPGTQKENIQEMHQKGRGGYTGQPGEQHVFAKITWHQAMEIRDLRAHGFSQQWIADHYHICQTRVSRIVRGLAWKEAA